MNALSWAIVLLTLGLIAMCAMLALTALAVAT